MAEEIKLVGVFQDNITPQLKKLNKEIKSLHRSFEKFGRRLRPIAKDMGVLAMATERVAKGLKEQRKAIDGASKSWSNYRREVGKAGSATRKAFPKATAPGAPRVPKGGRSGGGGGTVGLSGAVFGATVGNTIANFAARGVAKGFEIGVALMQKPFTYLANALGERIEDEMSDIQSAGGMFALDKKNAPGARLFNSFAEARSMQERLNRSLAESAAALPGATNDYVRAARGLTDTVMMAFGKNQEEFKKFAEELGAQKGATSEQALTKVLQRFTEQTVLLGQGQRGGMPLTMLMEQLVQNQNVNITGMRRRYAQLRQNPLLASMLEEAQDEINQSAAGSAERFRAVMKALDRALPQEVVNAMRMSASGIQEAIRSSFLDPDTGLLGLGRELNVMVSRVDDFGNVAYENGKVVKENTTLFKVIRDTLGGFLLPLSELAGILPEIFDPLTKVAEGFVELRETAMKFLSDFTAYTNWFKQNEFKDSGARGALAAINNFLVGLGAINDSEFAANAAELKKKGGSLAEIGKRLLKQLFSSDFMKQVGETIGRAIGEILSAVATILTGVTSNTKSGPFAEGFKKGFDDAGGKKAISDIIKGVFGLMLEGIGALFKAAPLEMTGISLAVIFGPALLGALSTAFAGWLVPALGTLLKGIFIKLGAAFSTTKLAGVIAGSLGAVGPMMQGLAATIAGTLGAVGPMAKALGTAVITGLKGLIVKVFAFLASGAGMAAAAAAIGAILIYAFQDTIKATFDNVGAWVKANTSGPLQALLMGVIRVWKSVIDVIAGFVGMIHGIVTGDGEKVKQGFSQFMEGMKNWAAGLWQVLQNLGGAVNQGLRYLKDAIFGLFRSLGDAIKNAWQNRPSWLGGSSGAMGNAPAAAGGIANAAAGHGLTMTSGYRPGDPGWHGVGRAMDFSNSTGPTPQMAAFAKQLEQTHGSQLKELIYTPLGYSIKNGKRVAPLAAGSHYNHVHVAYGMGAGNPAFFSSQGAAKAWERRVAPTNSTIASVTTNSAEMGGGPTVTVGSINISGVNDPKMIADHVAEEILLAVRKVSYSETNIA